MALEKLEVKRKLNRRSVSSLRVAMYTHQLSADKM